MPRKPGCQWDCLTLLHWPEGREEKEEGRRPKPPSALTFSVVPVHHNLQPSTGTGAQPHCEVGPACWPRPGPPPARGQIQWAGASVSPAFPATCSRSSRACGSGASASANPKAVHLAANPAACGCQVWFRGQSVEWLLGVCVSLYTKGTDYCISPFVLMPLLHSPYPFLTFWSPGNFSYDDCVFWWFTNFFYFEVILFSYGWEKRKWKECWGFHHRDKISPGELKSPKHWINYFSKKKLNLDRLRFLGPRGNLALEGGGAGAALAARLLTCY